MRIISICPSNTELLAYLGVIDQLIAVDDYSDWPASVNQLVRLGPDLDIRMDEVEALQPDLVLASLSVPGMEKNVEELVRRNIPHIVLNGQSLEEIAEDLKAVGQAVGTNTSSVVNSYQQLIEEMKARAANVHTNPSLYWEWWPKPVFTPGRVNWLTEISHLAGAKNVFEDIEKANIQTDWDEVLKRNPDFILLAWVGVMTSKVKPALLKKRPGWNGLKAMDHIYVMEEDLYCRPSPRLLEGAIRLGKLIHPQHFGDMDIPSWLTLD